MAYHSLDTPYTLLMPSSYSFTNYITSIDGSVHRNLYTNPQVSILFDLTGNFRQEMVVELYSHTLAVFQVQGAARYGTV